MRQMTFLEDPIKRQMNATNDIGHVLFLDHLSKLGRFIQNDENIRLHFS